jgi:hypothetical protein
MPPKIMSALINIFEGIKAANGLMAAEIVEGSNPKPRDDF